MVALLFFMRTAGPSEDMEALLLRIVPAAERATWTGATPEQIDAIEAIAGRPLPQFYRWFLARMGGSYVTRRQDLGAQTVLDAYRRGVVSPDPRYLLIGRNPDPVMPRLVFYDLDAPCRDDAMVATRPESGLPWEQDFETLREKLAWGMLLRNRVAGCAQTCLGSFTDDAGEVFTELTPMMAHLGFGCPIPTGAFCGLYERDDAVMACMSTVKESNRGLQFFELGGPDAGLLRRLLGEIATGTSLEIEIDEWEPSLGP